VYHCDLCDLDFESKDQFGGHISSHVRRGEMQKRKYLKHAYPRKCDKCDFVAETFSEFGGHVRSHKIKTEDLKTDGSRKLRLIKTRGHKCEICSTADWFGASVPLELDHIDGNSDNNSLDNVRLICPNCHALQPTSRGKNAGKFPMTKRNVGRAKYYLSASDRRFVSAKKC